METMDVEKMLKIDAIKDELRASKEIAALNEEKQLFESSLDGDRIANFSSMLHEFRKEMDTINLIMAPDDISTTSKDSVKIILSKENQGKLLQMFEDLAQIFNHLDENDQFTIKSFDDVRRETKKASALWKNCISLRDELNSLLKLCDMNH